VDGLGSEKIIKLPFGVRGGFSIKLFQGLRGYNGSSKNSEGLELYRVIICGGQTNRETSKKENCKLGVGKLNRSWGLLITSEQLKKMS